MSKLIYIANVSLDGYIEDADGNFDWTTPDDEVFAFITDLVRLSGTYLYGRRMYETMAVWETLDVSADPGPMRDYAEIWRAADKIVYSHTLAAPSTPRTRIERELDPAAVRDLKAGAVRDISVGGPGLAAHALRAGLVDEIHLLLVPVVVGSGTRALPDEIRIDLELAGERRFASGVVHLAYRVAA
jgi:dihydrofolate reductase